jgi:hypothetical protein
MRAVLISLLLALIAFTLVVILPAPLGPLSLLRAFVFLFGSACLVAAVLLAARSLDGLTTGALRAREH